MDEDNGLNVGEEPNWDPTEGGANGRLEFGSGV